MTATRTPVVRSDFAPGRWLGRVTAFLIVGFFAVFFVLPLVWLLLAPTKDTAQLNGFHGEASLSFGSFEQLVANWNELVAFQDGRIWTWLGNSVFYAGVALVLTLLVSIPAGYALAKTNFRFRRAILISTLMVMLIPNTALVLPIFLEINAVHLVGSPLAVILPFAFFPFGVYLAYIYFSTSVSRELLDAARIDGAGEFVVFWRIALPLAIPVVALVGFFNFVTNWNNYFLPFVMLPGSKTQPIQVGLVELLANVREFNPTTVASDSIPFPQLALATLISVAPVLIVFMFSQRFLGRASPPGRPRSRSASVERTRRFGMACRMFRTKRRMPGEAIRRGDGTSTETVPVRKCQARACAPKPLRCARSWPSRRCRHRRPRSPRVPHDAPRASIAQRRRS